MWPCRSGKRLLHTALLQERCKCGGSILLAAVAVKCQIGRGISFAESYPKCTGDQIRAGIAGYAIADDFPGKEVENDAQIKPVIVELEVCNITDPCLIRMFCGKLLLQQVLLAVFLMLFKLLFGIKSNAAQIELLHDRSNALGADSDTTFGQCNANLFGTIPLAAVVESLLYQTHELCLLLVALAAVRTAKDVVVKCTASDIQCFAQLMNTISIIRLMVEIFQNGKSLLQGNIILHCDGEKRPVTLKSLNLETAAYFKKTPPASITEFVLSRKTILVEGPAEYILFEKFYETVTGHVPENDDVQILDVRGLSFKRYLDIACLTKGKVAVVTDNDGNVQKNCIEKYIGYSDMDNVKICYEPDERKRTFEIVLYCENKGLCDKLFSGDAQQYMLNNKTDAAYRLLCQNDDISVPSYIKEAFEWISE